MFHVPYIVTHADFFQAGLLEKQVPTQKVYEMCFVQYKLYLLPFAVDWSLWQAKLLLSCAKESNAQNAFEFSMFSTF